MKKTSPKVLIVFNYAMDLVDPIFSHQSDLIRYLANDFSKVIVITGKVGEYRQEKNVKIVNLHWIPGHNLRNSLSLLISAVPILYKHRKKAVIFSHMTEVQSALIGPLCKLLGVKHILWYAHKSKSLYLKWDHLFVNKILTSTEGSCPIKSSKVIPIGQGIDEKIFTPRIRKDFKTLKLVTYGRFDKSKNINKLVETAITLSKKYNYDVKLLSIGSPTQKNLIYYNHLKAKVKNLPWIEFLPSVPRGNLMDKLENYNMFIHAFEGSLDKSLLEATLMGLPVFTTNSEYLREIGSWSKYEYQGEGDWLVTEIISFLKLDKKSQYSKISERIEKVIENHNFQSWAKRISYELSGTR